MPETLFSDDLPSLTSSNFSPLWIDNLERIQKISCIVKTNWLQKIAKIDNLISQPELPLDRQTPMGTPATGKGGLANSKANTPPRIELTKEAF